MTGASWVPLPYRHCVAPLSPSVTPLTASSHLGPKVEGIELIFCAYVGVVLIFLEGMSGSQLSPTPGCGGAVGPLVGRVNPGLALVTDAIGSRI